MIRIPFSFHVGMFALSTRARGKHTVNSLKHVHIQFSFYRAALPLWQSTSKYGLQKPNYTCWSQYFCHEHDVQL